MKILTSCPTQAVLYLVLSFFLVPEVRAELKPGQVRRVVARMAGFKLPDKAVTVRTVAETGPTAAEALVDIETAYRLEEVESGHWRVQEIRVGPDVWEQITLIGAALGADVPGDTCNDPERFITKPTVTEPSPRRARCLLASLVSVELPSDAVRIRQISPLSLPLASRPSAMAVVRIQVRVRLGRDSRNAWQVLEIRPGNRGWTNLEHVLGALNQEKSKLARADLETLSIALEKFRQERGFYVSADNASVMVDYLSPRYLQRVIRVDPWHIPYQYQGTSDHFTLRSTGPDGKENTPDDILLASSSPKTSSL